VALAEVVAPLLDMFQGDIGIYVRHLKTGEEFAHQAELPFLTASVFKIPVLVEVFRQSEAGSLSLDRPVTVRREDKRPGSGILKELADGHVATVRELAMLMIIVSDNTATDLLLKFVGKEAVNATLGDLGMERTRVDLTCEEILSDLITPLAESNGETEVGAWRGHQINLRCRALTDLKQNDVSTPREMSTLLELIHTGRAASPASCEAMGDILSRQQVNDRIPGLLSATVAVAHKTGELPGIRNDAGIVYSPSGPYLFTAFTRKLPHEVMGCRQVAELSKAVFNYFCGG
jgi:beta-lactamase class A